MPVTAKEIAANLYMITLPIPVPFLESINIYVVVGFERNLIVDTGFFDDECLMALQSALRRLDVNLRKTDFFITHGHPDHFGLLGRLMMDGSRVYVSADEVRQINRAVSTAIMADYARFLLLAGFPERDPHRIFPHDTLGPYQIQRSWDFRFIQEDDLLEYGGHGFRCVATPGHTGGHTCLYDSDEGLLLSGDHLLPDISPTIQLWYETGNPLGSYLTSLDKVSELDVDLVLPGHGPIFRNCKERIGQLKEHHASRLEEILSALSDGCGSDVYEIASKLSWSLSGCADWDSAAISQRFFATGETFSHLKYLEKENRIRREMKDRMILYLL